MGEILTFSTSHHAWLGVDSMGESRTERGNPDDGLCRGGVANGQDGNLNSSIMGYMLGHTLFVANPCV